MSNKPTIVIAGHVTIDRNDIDGVKVERWGGPCMYIPKYLRRQYGVDCHIIAPYGRDFLPYADGFELVNRPGEHGTLAYENIVKHGKRVQYAHNTAASGPPPLNERARYLLSQADGVIVATLIGNFDQTYVRELLSLVPPTCQKTLIPQGYMRRIDAAGKSHRQPFAEAAELVPLFDMVVYSDEDCNQPLEAAAEWSRLSPDTTIAVTQHWRGATLFWRGRQSRIPTTPIAFNRIKNPVGSGEIFAGAMAYNLLDGASPTEAVRIANRLTGEMLLAPKPLS